MTAQAMRPVRPDNFSTIPSAQTEERHYPWWQVMCLSGVDYFSTLGYQPGIAVQSAGVLAPVATLVLVAVTLLGAVPVYRMVAKYSPHGLGSIAMIEKLVRGWPGKVLVLILLGFAATDFIITITLSAADASAHLLHTADSPHQIPVTISLIAALCIVFLIGFREAVSVAVVLVSGYLAMTAIVVAVGLARLVQHPELLANWQSAVHTQHPHPGLLVLAALVVFPKLALGMSGFETGVSVMPLIRASSLEDRVGKARRLLLTSAVIMSVFLLLSSVLASMLIPADEFAPGGGADGRALAWIAGKYIGASFGTAYAYATTAILWFAGASAMSGMLALIPKYLPRFGMAPEWARRSRPMVLLLTGIAVLITLIFRASVDTQSGAYATGVLVVMCSGAVAVTLTARGPARAAFGATSVILALTLVANVVERPDGIRVAAFFIVVILVASFASRASRSYELRDVGIEFDEAAESIIRGAISGGHLAVIPAAPHLEDPDDGPGEPATERATEPATDCALRRKEARVRRRHNLDPSAPVVVLVISLRDPSSFAEPIEVRGTTAAGREVLNVQAVSIPNAIAAITLAAQREFGVRAAVYFEWGPGGPLIQALRFIFFGRGQVATVSHEILRRAVAEERDRPEIHVA